MFHTWTNKIILKMFGFFLMVNNFDKNYFTFHCMTESFLLLGNIRFYLIWQNIQLNRFLFFCPASIRERNKFSIKRKKKDLMDNNYFFTWKSLHLISQVRKKKNNLLTSSQKHRRETGNNNLTCEVNWLFFLPRESFFCFMCETEREQIVQGEKLFFYSI